MGIELGAYRENAQAAVRHFWLSREKSATRQRDKGQSDQGTRSSVTSGKNMDGFVKMITEIVVANELPEESVQLRARVLTLPGFFRPTKNWDVLVVNEGHLIAAIEFKSQVGSFGNNFNNRSEEAIGVGLDLATAYREGAFGDNPRPFVGWLMLLEDCERSNSPVSCLTPHFPVFSEFKNASYAERYHILCKRMMQENIYDAAVLLLASSGNAKTGEYKEFDSMTGLESFVSLLAGRIAAEAARTR